MDNKEIVPAILGPFVGSITADSVKLWFQLPVTVENGPITIYVTLHQMAGSARLKHAQVVLSAESYGCGIANFSELLADSDYYYVLWYDYQFSKPVEMEGLVLSDLRFRTLPEKGYEEQLDFLLMSCHNPETAKGDGADGFAVWRQIPEIISQNKNIRFAILAGDQIYADEVEAKVLRETDELTRERLYLNIYQKFWSNIYYRRVLCSLPAVFMWDDHDITDGWGSREDSFVGAMSPVTEKSSEFRAEWLGMFQAAREMFLLMQAKRNPDPLSPQFTTGFDYCFQIGRAGFLVADLRSNRNVRKGTIWLPEQMAAIRTWVETNRSELDTVFFISTVVFSHGAPQVDNFILRFWFFVLDCVKGLGKIGFLKGLSKKFMDSVGDLRDDINDSWGSDVNASEAETALDFLFSIQNPGNGELPVNVVILSGDIHTPGYSTIYSSEPNHAKRAAIPHVVASPVAYTPFRGGVILALASKPAN